MKRFLAILLSALLLAALFPLSFAAAASGGTPSGGMLDEIIIEFFPKSDFPGKEKQYDDEVAKVLKDGVSVVTGNVYVIKTPDHLGGRRRREDHQPQPRHDERQHNAEKRHRLRV